jgi:hypothetical protein
MDNEFISLQFIEKDIALMTFKQPTLTIESVRVINEGLDFLLKKEVSPLALITTSSHDKIYCAGLNFKIFVSNI